MKQDKNYSIITTISIMVIAFLSMIWPIDYFRHIATAVSLPLFGFTLLEIGGHVKVSIERELTYELEKMGRDEEWMRGYYNMLKDSTEDYAEKVKKDYNELTQNITKTYKEYEIIRGWFSFYNFLYILLGVILFTVMYLANLKCSILFFEKIDSTSMTLLTFALFIGEPYLVDVLSKRIRTKASKKITNFATSSCGRNEN